MTAIPSAVVVGATGELGVAIVGRMCEAGVPVVAVARDRGRLEQLSATLDGITVCAADLGADSSGEAITAALAGPVPMVVQAAAVPPAGPLSTIGPEALGRAVSLKLAACCDSSEPSTTGSSRAPESSPSVDISVPNPLRKPGPRGVTVHMIAPGALDTDRLRRFASATAAARGVSVRRFSTSTELIHPWGE